MNVTTNYKASSTIIAGMLAGRELGYQFTSVDLLEEINTDPMQPQVVTLGSVAGFLNKAAKSGVITSVGTEKSKGGNPRIKYELIAPEKIKVKDTPGTGSPRGTQHKPHKMPYEEIAKKMNLADKIEAVADLGIAADEERKAAEHTPGGWTGEVAEQIVEQAHARDPYPVIKPLPDSVFTNAYGLPEPVAEVFGRMHSALIDALQPQPVKTLADYSADELIAELRSRLR